MQKVKLHSASIICVSSGLYFMFVFFQFSMLDVINLALRMSFHVDATQISYVANSFKILNLLCLFPAGMLLDKYSVKKIIIVTFTICILGTLGFSYAESYHWLVIYYASIGIGNAFCLAAGVVLISRWLPEKRHGFYIGLLITMGYTGGIFSQYLFNDLVFTIGWRLSILYSAMIGVAMLLWIIFIIQDYPASSSGIKKTNRKISVKHHQASIWKNKQNWLTGIFIGLMDCPLIVFGTLWGISYLEQSQRLSQINSGKIIAVFFLGAILGCSLAGYISDMLQKRKPIMYIGAIGLTFCYIPLLVNTIHTDVFLIMQFFIMGLCSSIQTVGYPLIAENNLKQNIGKATSVATFTVISIGAIGTGFFSRMLDYISNHQMANLSFDYSYVVWFFPISSLLALIVLFFIRENNATNIPNKSCNNLDIK